MKRSVKCVLAALFLVAGVVLAVCLYLGQGENRVDGLWMFRGSVKALNVTLLGLSLVMIAGLTLAFWELLRRTEPDRLPAPAEAEGKVLPIPGGEWRYHPLFQSGTSWAVGCEVLPGSQEGKPGLDSFRHCCQWAAARADSGLMVFCPLSGDLLVREGTAEELIRLAAEAGTERGSVLLTVEPDGVEAEQAVFQTNAARLRQAGFRLCLDRFGRRNGVLGGLTELAPDAVKLDQSLVQLTGEEAGRAAFRSTVQLAKGTGASVICSGIETAAQRSAAEEAGCDLLQGAYFCKPLREGAFDRLLAGRTRTQQGATA